MEAAKQPKINTSAEFQPFTVLAFPGSYSDSQKKSADHYACKQIVCLKKLLEYYLREHRSKARLNISKQKLLVRIMPGNSV
jgi:hypothetical protein